jgi:hypothetical protein
VPLVPVLAGSDMKNGENEKYLRRDIPSLHGLRNLDVVHHGKVPACSLVCTYYTGNRQIFMLERYYKMNIYLMIKL